MSIGRLSAGEFPEGIEMIPCTFADGKALLQLYLVKSERMALIDTGVADTPQNYIFPYLHERGWTAKDVSMVVNTHGHHDHFGGNGQFHQANPQAEIAVHRNDLEWVENPQRHFNEMYHSYPGEWDPDDQYENTVIGWCGVPAPVSRILHDDDFLVLDRNAGIQCIAVPSHTRGHVLLYQKQLDTAFSGDSIQGGGIALTTGIYVFPLYDSVENYLLSLRKIGDLQAKYVCTGHCGILDREQTESALNESKQFVDTHSQYLLEVLRKSSGPLSLHELAAALHESYYRQYELAFQIHATTHTHCRFLEAQNLVERVATAGKLKWQLKR